MLSYIVNFSSKYVCCQGIKIQNKVKEPKNNRRYFLKGNKAIRKITFQFQEFIFSVSRGRQERRWISIAGGICQGLQGNHVVPYNQTKLSTAFNIIYTVALVRILIFRRVDVCREFRPKTTKSLVED